MAAARRAPPVVYYGEYLAKKKFGAGAQSRTFLAEKGANSNKLFMLKIVNYFTEEEQKQAEKEIEQLERLKSPHTVHLICSFMDRTDMVMVFEFCERGDLRTEIAELQKLPIKERVMNVWEIFAQMALSVNHLHSHDVLHCDIKPENIFVMADKSVKLGDFGLLKVLADQGYATTVVGTKPYMAPEVFTKKRMDKQSDMYSFGIVVFELLTGKHPFAADSEQAMLIKMANNEVGKLPEQVPKELADLVMRMMNKDERRRPPITEILDNSTIQMYIRQHNSKSKTIQQESDEKLRIADERARLAEERTRQAEEKARAAEEQALKSAQVRIKAAEEKARLAEERARIAEDKIRKSQKLQKMNIPKGDKGRVERSSFVHSNERYDSTITMDPIINQGVTRFEVIFNGHDGEEFSLGIVKASQVFKKNDLPIGMTQFDVNEKKNEKQQQKKQYELRIEQLKQYDVNDVDVEIVNVVIDAQMNALKWHDYGDNSVRFKNNGYLENRRYYITDSSIPIKENSPFVCGQRISIEVDMNSIPRRAIFFSSMELNKRIQLLIFQKLFVSTSLYQNQIRHSKLQGLKNSLFHLLVVSPDQNNGNGVKIGNNEDDRL